MAPRETMPPAEHVLVGRALGEQASSSSALAASTVGTSDPLVTGEAGNSNNGPSDVMKARLILCSYEVCVLISCFHM